MPGKVNPVMAECLNMVCFQLLGFDATIAMAVQAGQMELNVMMPVIAYNHGSVPEIIEHGVTGFIVGNEAEGIAALAQIHTLDRKLIRKRFEARFTASRMAKDYVDTYESLIVPQEKQLRLVQ